MEVRRDCPECRSAGSVEGGECQVCFEAVPEAGPAVVVVPAGPLRFADVVAEIEAVAALAALGSSGNLADACRRARSLLERLRGQFVAEVILAPPGTPPVPEAPGSEPPAAAFDPVTA